MWPWLLMLGHKGKDRQLVCPNSAINNSQNDKKNNLRFITPTFIIPMVSSRVLFVYNFKYDSMFH